MNIEKVKKIKDRVVASMQEMGYSAKSIKGLKGCCNAIVKHGSGNDIMSYEDFYNKIIVPNYAVSTANDKKWSLGVLWYYEKYGKMAPPDLTKGFMCKSTKRYESLSEEYRYIVDTYCATKLKEGNMPTTVSSCKYSLVKFLDNCISNGKCHVADITEDFITEYYKSENIKTSKITHILRDAFSYAAHAIPQCLQMVPLFPEVKSAKKPYEALDPEEAEKLKNAIDHMDDHWLLRDKAIAVIVYYLGLRRGDIAKLKIDSVNFKENKISFLQSKNCTIQEMPLRPIVGNAIYDYIKYERPKCEFDNLFVIDNDKGIRPITTGGVYIVMQKIFKAAGVRIESGRKGVHIFRHNLASRMIHGGSNSVDVTAILGHISPQSLNAYLSADELALKECALSIEQYPINSKTYAQYL